MCYTVSNLPHLQIMHHLGKNSHISCSQKINISNISDNYIIKYLNKTMEGTIHDGEDDDGSMRDTDEDWNRAGP